nr:hypothetical protein [Desulfobulbaceae bacterium]
MLDKKMISHTGNTSIYVKIWFLYFSFVFIVASSIQFIVLPYVFPSLHAGEGLLVGGDWNTFHKVAVRLANAIHEQGWNVWQLKPELGLGGSGAVGVAAFFYVLVAPHPWALIPLNSVMHATSAFLLFLLAQRFVKNWRLASLCSLPFLVYPSAATWYASLHKDGYSILGMFFVLYGWIALTEKEAWDSGVLRVCRPLSAIMLGVILVWSVRHILVQFLFAMGLLVYCIVTLYILFSKSKQKNKISKKIICLFLMWLTIPYMSLFQGPYFYMPTGVSVKEDNVELIKKQNGTIDNSIDNSNVSVSSGVAVGDEKVIEREELLIRAGWTPTSWMPSSIDGKIFEFTITRRGFISIGGGAGTNIDHHIVFGSVSDVLRYLPRAEQIALFSPFPHLWFGEAKQRSNTMMRRISAIEMLGVYVSLFFLPLSIFYWYQDIRLWIILVFSNVFLLSHSLVVANIGTLYRYRYPYLMALVTIGVAAMMKFIFQRKIANEGVAFDGSG